jgi:hypothetical protein
MRLSPAILVAFAMSTSACVGNESLESTTSHATVAFSGHITGKAYVTVTPPGLTPRRLYINNMKVEVRKKDSLGDTVVGSGVTGEGGVFDVAYSADSSSNIELYLHFIAESGDGMVRVRKKGVFDKWSRNQDVLKTTPLVVLLSSPTVSPPDQGEIGLDKTELKPQLLHWANRARQFVNEELGADSPLPTNTSDPLDILTPPLTQGALTFFVPATMVDEVANLAALGLLPLVSPGLGGLSFAYINTQFSDQDALYISETNDDDDDTTMHEFGHYVMWHAQGEKWLNPLEASFATHYAELNATDSKLAWTEGLATAFALMVDNWSFADDQESDSESVVNSVVTLAIDGLGNYSTPTCNGGGITCNGQATSHGFFSEHYISHMLYDLWDGPTNLAAGPNAVGTNGVTYNDTGFDNVELSFAEIMEPILDTRTGNQASLIDNIVDYHGRLYPLHNDRALKDLFVGTRTGPTTTLPVGRIRNLQVSAGTNPVLQDILNTDPIAFSRNVEIENYRVTTNPANTPWLTLVSTKATQIEPFTVDVSTLLRTTDDYNLGVVVGNAVTLSDDLVVDGSSALGNATLSFNSRTRPIGFRLPTNTYSAPAGILMTTPAQLNVAIASGTKLSAKDRGTLVLGDVANGQMATVTVAAGATLTLGGGAGGDFPQLDVMTNQMVSKGKVFIHPGSKLIIERGGKLVINKGAEITLDGIGAELIIRGDLEVSPDATFWWASSGGALVTFDLPSLPNSAANVKLGTGSHILLHEVPFVIANSTYMRLPEVTSTRLTIENGAHGHFGTSAYIDAGTKASVTLDESVIDALGAGLHGGIVLNGNANAIDEMTFSGGLNCLRDTKSGATLTVTHSDFSSCKTAIDVTGASVGLTDVTILGGTTGLWTRNSVNVGINGGSVITGAGVGWRLTNRGNGLQGVSDSDIAATGTGVWVEGASPAGAPPVTIADLSTISGGAYGVRSIGSRIRIERSTIQNSAIGVRMESTAILDLGASASVQFIGNDTSIDLLGGGTPTLDGSNLFYPKLPLTPGFALKGTIVNTAACTTPHTLRVTSDRWEVWNAGAAAYLAQSMTTSPYDVKSLSGCAYTLVN